MPISYLKTALRLLLRHRLYAAINIVGLSVGLACSLLILTYVQHELSYEAFNDRADRLYQVMHGDRVAYYPTPVAGLLVHQLPQVAEVARVFGTTRPLIGHGNFQAFHPVMSATPNLFDLIGIPVRWERRDGATPPLSLVISQRMARSYFGDQDPLGATMDWDNTGEAIVIGVFERPSNTHLDVDLVLFDAVAAELDAGREWRGGRVSNYYVLLAPGASPEAVGSDLLAAAERYGQEWLPRFLQRDGKAPILRAVADIHRAQSGGARHVHLLAMIGGSVLLVACVNFINLFTARSAQRVKEVGMRKTLGAQRWQLAGQFLMESTLQALAAACLAMLLARSCAPAYEALTGLELSVLEAGSALWWQVGALAGVALLGAGYPAVVLARLRPSRVFRDASRSGSMGVVLRRRLVEVQFAMAILLALGTLVVYGQLRHMRQSDLGFDKEHILTFRTGYTSMRPLSPAMARAMAQVPGVVGVAGHNDPPLFQPDIGRFRAAYVRVVEADRAMGVPKLVVNGSFVETMGLHVRAGRGHRPHLPDRQPEYVLNRSAVAAMGFADERAALGATVHVGAYGTGPVVGIVDDFHRRTLHHSIEPLILISPTYTDLEGGGRIQYYANTIVRIAPGALPEVLDDLAAVWETYGPEYPFVYEFLDQHFELRHRTEIQLSRLLGWFTATALVLTGLGVFAMAAFSADQRTKEIGVRKVLGAGDLGILALFAREMGRLFGMGVMVAVPLGVWGTGRWLEGFPYRIEVSWTIVVGAVVAVLSVAALAMSQQVVRASRLRPVEALRSE